MAEQFEMAIEQIEGAVVLFVPDHIKPHNGYFEITMPPEVARGVAEEIARKAFEGEFKGKPVNSNMLVEQKRAKMLRRVELILNNLDKRKVKRSTIAAQVVDTVLGEVL